MGTVVFTNTLVQSRKPTDKEYEIRDKKIPKLVLRVRPGGSKTYRCNYKRGASVTIGDANVLTVHQARTIAITILGDIAKGIEPKKNLEQKKQTTSNITFQSFLDTLYLPWFKQTHPKTRDSDIRHLKRLFHAMANKKLHEISTEIIEKWIATRLNTTRLRMRNGKHVQEKIKPNTIKRNIALLRMIFKKAKQWNYMRDNPADNINVTAPIANRTRVLTKEELQRVLAALDAREIAYKNTRKHTNASRSKRDYPSEHSLEDSSLSFVDHLKPMVLLLIGSGMRFGSLIQLRWEQHIDFSCDQYLMIRLTPDIVKTNKSYTIPLDEGTSNNIKKWYTQTKPHHQGNGWVFPNPQDRNKHIKTIKTALKNLFKRANIDLDNDDILTYVFRHTYISNQVEANIHPSVVAKNAGHTDSKTTERYYIHVSEAQQIRAMEETYKWQQTFLEN